MEISNDFKQFAKSYHLKLTKESDGLICETDFIGLINDKENGCHEIVDLINFLNKSYCKGLCLKNSCIDHEGFQAIAEFIANTKTLRTLNLQKTNPNKEQEKMIKDALHLNNSIQLVYFNNQSVYIKCQLYKEIQIEIKDALA